MIKNIVRIIVALIFIASGFVKAIDAVGFSFKLEEYFSPGVFNLPFLEQFALPISIFVVALELILGVALLLKMDMKRVLKILITLCVFFGFLTFYSAYYNKVTDCGCFGDAIKFTPWQSFIKDIVLLIGLIILWFLYKKDFKNEKSTFKNFALLLAVIGSAFIIIKGIITEPIIDFRAYKIGTNLNDEKKKIAENPSEFKVFYTLKNKTTGELKEVMQDDYIKINDYWKEGTPWEILTDKSDSKLTKQGYESEISKFKLTDASGNDLTEEVLKAPKAAIIFSYAPAKVDADDLIAIETFFKGTPETLVLGVAPDLKVFKFVKQATMDGTAIKTIARSNPFVLFLENGKIVDKGPAKSYLK